MAYVVDELLETVHNAIDKNKVLSVELEWAKFIVYWSKSGPGCYAGIKIVKKGEWPSLVVRSASTRQRKHLNNFQFSSTLCTTV